MEARTRPDSSPTFFLTNNRTSVLLSQPLLHNAALAHLPATDLDRRAPRRDDRSYAPPVEARGAHEQRHAALANGRGQLARALVLAAVGVPWHAAARADALDLALLRRLGLLLQPTVE